MALERASGPRIHPLPFPSHPQHSRPAPSQALAACRLTGDTAPAAHLPCSSLATVSHSLISQSCQTYLQAARAPLLSSRSLGKRASLRFFSFQLSNGHDGKTFQGLLGRLNKTTHVKDSAQVLCQAHFSLGFRTSAGQDCRACACVCTGVWVTLPRPTGSFCPVSDTASCRPAGPWSLPADPPSSRSAPSSRSRPKWTGESR